MAKEEATPVETQPVEPVESPATELANIVNEGDPDLMLALLEKKAELATRFKAAQDTILASQTYPADWQVFGEGDKAKACLSSAGAERVGRLFDYKVFDVKARKEEFTDSNGKAYRYVYEGFAMMGNKTIFAQGVYGIRDKFLGYANNEWKSPEEINENHVRNAAYHIFIGNAIKSLLGLRGIPADEYKEIMGKTGQKAERTGKHTYGSGTKGGTSTDDSGKQKELAELCIKIATAGWYVELYQGEWKLTQMTDAQSIAEPVAVAEGICTQISGFKGKDGWVNGLPANKLKGKRLSITLKTATMLVEKM